MEHLFTRFANSVSRAAGRPLTFVICCGSIVLWAATGPLFGFSDTWQLAVNTSTTIITFLMVFLIQNTQNRDMLSMQLKLSELVLAMHGAKNKFAAVEDLTDAELEELHEDCRARAELTLDHLERRGKTATRSAAATAKANRRTAKT